MSCMRPGAGPECADGEAHNPTYPYTLSAIPTIGKIGAVGYSLGGNVAVHAAALDARIEFVASFAGFTPMRTDGLARPTGGLRRLYELHALLPRLALFADLSTIPYDYADLFRLIAPRPTLVHAPVDDRSADDADLTALWGAVRDLWNATGALQWERPAGGSVMGAEESAALRRWMRGSVVGGLSVVV